MRYVLFAIKGFAATRIIDLPQRMKGNLFFNILVEKWISPVINALKFMMVLV